MISGKKGNGNPKQKCFCLKNWKMDNSFSIVTENKR